MPFVIDFQNEIDAPNIPVERITGVLTELLTAHTLPPDAGLTIVITDDAQVAALNEQFRGIVSPTDVLSFPSEIPRAPSDWSMVEPEYYLGDLLIAYPYTVIRRRNSATRSTMS